VRVAAAFAASSRGGETSRAAVARRRSVMKVLRDGSAGSSISRLVAGGKVITASCPVRVQHGAEVKNAVVPRDDSGGLQLQSGGKGREKGVSLQPMRFLASIANLAILE